MSNPYFDVDVDFDVRAFNRVRNQLRGLASKNQEITNPVVEKHVKNQSAKLRKKAYPAMLPNQKYRRTYELQRRFRAQKKGKGWSVINRTPYAVYVIKRGYQNRQYHEWRWWTMEDVMEESMPTLTTNLTIALEDWMDNQ